MTITSTDEGTAVPRASKGSGTVGVVTAALLAFGGIVATPLAAQADEEPSFTTEVTENPNESIDIAISGTGFGDVTALPGQDAPHAYFTLVEEGSELGDVSQGDTAISAVIDDDGNIDDELTVSADSLDDSTDYEVISWPSRSNPSEANLYARASVEIDWAALFPDNEPDEDDGGDPADGDEETPNEGEEDEGTEEDSDSSVAFTTEVTEHANDRIEVAISGTGYEASGAYFALIAKDSDLDDVDPSGAISASTDDDGSIQGNLTVDAANLDASTDYEVISWPQYSFPSVDNMFARTAVEIDWEALFPEDAPSEDEAGQSPEFTTAVTENPNEGIDIAISGTGFGDVEALPGQDAPHAYFTLIEEDTDLSEVAQSDTAISASIDEEGNIEGILTVSADALDADKNYEVISWPSRSNPSETNLYARASVEIDWETLFPGDSDNENETPDDEEEQPGDGEQEPPGDEETPNEGEEDEGQSPTGDDNNSDDSDTEDTPVITVNGDDDAAVRQGEEVTFSVSPVEAGTEFVGTVYSDPVDLGTITAHAEGTASTSWTVPADFEIGEHTVEFWSDSFTYEGTFTVVAAETPVNGDGGSAVDADGADVDGADVVTAADQTTGTGSSSLATTGASITAAAVIALLMIIAGALVVSHNRKRTAIGADGSKS